MSVLSQSFERKLRSASPNKRFDVILSLRKPYGETTLRGRLESIGARIINSGANSDFVMVSLTAANALRLPTLSDDIEDVLEDTPITLMR